MFYDFKNGLNKGKEFFGSGTPIVNFTDVFHNRRIYTKKLKGTVELNENEINRFKVEKGDLFFTRTSETINQIGYPSVLMDEPEDTVFSGFVLRGRAIQDDPLVNTFKSYVFFTESFRREMITKSSMTTRALTTGGALKQMSFSYPKHFSEQKNIGNLFLSLDQVIELHQRKINTFKQLKKSFLSGMFPIKGENTPRLRFNGYKEEWEQRKLGEVTDVRDGTHDSPKYFKEGYPLITSKNLKNDGLDLDNVSLISKEDFNKFNKRSKVHKGDILFGMIGTIGNPILINRDDFAIKNIALIKQSHEVLNVFIIQLLKSPVFQSYINRENEGGTQKFLSLGKIRDFSFKSPNSEEQNAVSNFLRNLDKSIALHQNKVTNLSILKTTYLRKMFL